MKIVSEKEFFPCNLVRHKRIDRKIDSCCNLPSSIFILAEAIRQATLKHSVCVVAFHSLTENDATKLLHTMQDFIFSQIHTITLDLSYMRYAVGFAGTVL